MWRSALQAMHFPAVSQPAPATTAVEPAAEEPRREGGFRRIAESHWHFGFIALLAYFVVEYSSIALQYPALQPLALGKVTVISSALGWLFLPKTARHPNEKTSTLDKTLLALLVATLMSTAFAEHLELAWNGFVDALRWAVTYFIISRLVNNAWRLRALCFVWLLLNFKMAQFVVRTFGYWRSAGADEGVLVRYGVGGSGLFGNSADMGVAMCVIWPISACLLFSRPKGIYKLLLMGCAVACMGAILLCGSRGAVVGAAAVVLAALIKSPRKVTAVVMVLLLAIGIWFVLPETSKERFESARTPEKDDTANHRLLLWKAGLQMFADYPLFGVGPSNFALVRWSHYPIADWRHNRAASVAHSTYIQTISELGMVGSVFVLALWLGIFRINTATRKHLLSLAPEQRRSFEYCLATGIDLGLIGYLASGAFVSVLWYPHMFVLLGLTAALHNVALNKKLEAKDAQTNRGTLAPALLRA